jgi:hypothetical protein
MIELEQERGCGGEQGALLVEVRGQEAMDVGTSSPNRGMCRASAGNSSSFSRSRKPGDPLTAASSSRDCFNFNDSSVAARTRA